MQSLRASIKQEKWSKPAKQVAWTVHELAVTTPYTVVTPISLCPCVSERKQWFAAGNYGSPPYKANTM